MFDFLDENDDEIQEEDIEVPEECLPINKAKPPKKGPRRNKLGQFIPGSGGRPTGVVNKYTTLKQSFLDAFKTIGGTDELIRWAMHSEANLASFYKMVHRMLPKELNLGAGENEIIDISIKTKLVDKLKGINGSK